MSRFIELAIAEQTKVLQGILDELRKINAPVRLSDYGRGIAGTVGTHALPVSGQVHSIMAQPGSSHGFTAIDPAPHSHDVGGIVEVSADELRHWGGASISRMVRTR